ncbi:substrate-binding domain-containing protein [Ornithinibacillus halophilus]|uniref:LysR family transcriptional regulator, repressor for citA n=1 Tax=Ornithinibacillus halophilus TaxID=930117 RepID=A0A1M5CJ77_9BACI|nr:substrate-binding domain-containing protein [Ornithinibacillus halophilus]SHF54804.1 LysR family transcriptional regulator, repressor for citA [Ornithinibacillus halophilus]
MNRLNRFKQGYHKTLRLAISPILSDTILPAIINKYIEENPRVELTIHVMESTEISSKIESGEVDIGLSCIPGSSWVKSIQFHEEDVPLIMLHDGYDSESGPYLDAIEILSNNILFTDNHPEYWKMLKPKLLEFIPSLKMMKINQSYITKRLVLEGIGVSFLPRSTIRRELLEGRLIEVPFDYFEPATARMFFIYKNDHLVDHDFTSFVSAFHFS